MSLRFPGARGLRSLLLLLGASWCLGPGLALPASAGCYPSLAAGMYRDMRRGGGSPGESWEATIRNGDNDGSRECYLRIKGYMKGLDSMFSDVLPDFR